MPALKNPRHETFAFEVARGSTAIDAYRTAGYSERGAGQSAHRLLKNADVQNRIAQIRAKMTATADLSLQDIAKNLLEDRDLAHRKENPSAAVQADLALAKLFGHISNKTDLRVQFNFTHEEALRQLGEQRLIDVTPGGPLPEVEVLAPKH